MKMTKVYIVIHQPTDGFYLEPYEILKVFSNYKAASDFHENIPIKKRSKCIIEDIEVIDNEVKNESDR
jgi:hypothetical protein